jgi:uncharacterized membrane protein YsdA (DUF1294 family)
MVTIILPLLIILNMAAFLTYGVDKKRAQRQQWRISDKTLLTLAIIAGFGAYTGMRVFHHKTRQNLFRAAAFIGMLINSVVFAWSL